MQPSKVTMCDGSVKLHIDNMSSRYVLARMVSKSWEIMREVRILQRLLARLGNTLDPKWLPSASNFFSNRVLSIWDPGEMFMGAAIA